VTVTVTTEARDEKTTSIVIEKVTKRFVHHGRVVPVLDGIDLAVDHGEMVCVVGASGAGKSTLLHILGTLDLPTEGRIIYDGVDVTKLPTRKLAAFRNEHVGFVFQFHHLLPEFTAIENVMMPGMIAGRRKAELRDRAAAILAEVGLSHRLTHRPGELSGGEQQRVAVARALVMEPRLVLADEPTGNLDSKTSEAIHDLLFQVNATRGTTFLIVTHSTELARRMPRVVEMRDGRILHDERRELPPRRAPEPAAEPAAPPDQA
jgi:lipoprotein-releasing system ATP-binding protein